MTYQKLQGDHVVFFFQLNSRSSWAPPKLSHTLGSIAAQRSSRSSSSWSPTFSSVTEEVDAEAAALSPRQMRLGAGEEEEDEEDEEQAEEAIAAAVLEVAVLEVAVEREVESLRLSVDDVDISESSNKSKSVKEVKGEEQSTAQHSSCYIVSLWTVIQSTSVMGEKKTI